MREFNTPILLIVFNRADTARLVLNEIRKIRPSQLFIAADGPRLDKNEEKACVEARQLAMEVDWPCEVKTNFLEENLGPRLAIGKFVTWFFDNVEAGIIFEHDCLPDSSFFGFCEELLEKYKDDKRIMHISGNFFQPQKIGEADYYFSYIPHIWGWATWRRAWQKYDVNMTDWPDNKKIVKRISKKWLNQQKWLYILQKVYEGRANTWDYQWTYAMLKNNGLAVNPNCNLVTNIGFGPGAVHSFDPDDKFAKLPLNKVDFSVVHPEKIIKDQSADDYICHNNFKFNFFKVLIKNCGIDLHKIFRK